MANDAFDFVEWPLEITFVFIESESKKNGEYNNDCSIIKALSGCHYGIILFLLTINQLNDSMYDSNHMEKVSRNQNSIAKINSMPFLLFAFQTCSVSPTIESNGE